MPFSQLIPRPFTQSAVQMYAPVESGVYGISNAREWIYIGETDNIKSALLSHLGGFSAALMQHHPTGFVYEVCAGERRPSRQVRLVLEYGPACNRELARHS